MAKINTINNFTSELTIDPGASGDSFVQFDIASTGEFRIGIDDDDSDTFKISQGSALGTNDTFIMTADGERTMPLQPAFLAISAADQNDVTGDSTYATGVFGTEIFDQASNFDGVSTFTAPLTGRYSLSAQIYASGLTASHTRGVFIFNTSNRLYYFIRLNIGAARDSSNSFACGATIIADMDALDTCTVQVFVSGGTLVVDIIATASTFGGFLIC